MATIMASAWVFISRWPSIASSKATTRPVSPRPYNDLVESAVRPDRAAVHHDVGQQGGPALDGGFTGKRGLDRLTHRLCPGATEKPEPSELHAEQRDVSISDQMDGLENRPIAAERDRERRLADLGRCDGEGVEPGRDGIR